MPLRGRMHPSRWFAQILAGIAAGFLVSSGNGLAGQVERLPLPSHFVPPTTVSEPLRDAAPAPTGPPPELMESTDGEISESSGNAVMPDHPSYNPVAWFLPSQWESTFKVGVNSSHGNADTFNIRTGVELSRETDLTNWDISLNYAKNENGDIITQHNALLYSDSDWKLPWERWSLFWKSGMEYDEFKNFNVRLNTNAGLGYMLVDTETSQFRSRFGSGTSREFGGVDEEWHPEAAFGFDYSHRLTSRQKMSTVFDYYPTWDNFSDYRFVGNFSWEVVLNETYNMSLKFNIIDRYDSTPNGARPNDVDQSVLLIWTL